VDFSMRITADQISSNDGSRDRREPPGATRSTFEQERREVLESVLEALAEERPDPGRSAACSYLLRHLMRGPRPARPPHCC
jgi:hypothetical protein